MTALFAAWLGLAAISTDGSTSDPPHPCRAQLVSGVEEAQAGRPFDVAIRITPDPHWHVYWHSPRDGGMPTEVIWKLPEGFRAGALRWPIPQRFEEEGNLISYGYEGEFWLLAEVTPPKEFSGTANIAAEVAWLVCKESCYPGSAEVSIRVPVGQEPAQPSKHAKAIAEWNARIPAEARSVAVKSSVAEREGETYWSLSARLGEDTRPGSIRVFPFDPPQARVSEPKFSWKSGELSWSTSVRVGGTQFKPDALAALVIYEVSPAASAGAGKTAGPKKPASKKVIRRAVVVRHREKR
ncbi:MAG: protein-disulfide reductase DsbD domain-containing protein [Planctomycetota bacterium]